MLAAEFLEHHFLQSIWYLHAQPPLFNMMIGAVLNWSPFATGFTFQVIYFAAGIALVFGLYDLARQLRLGPVVAAVVALVIACGPPVVRWRTSSTTTTSSRCSSCGSQPQPGVGYATEIRALGAITGLAAATVLLRSFMHPLVFVVVAALPLVLRRPRAWNGRIVAALAIPLVLVGGTMLKNEVVFGTPELSTWLGYNAQRVAVNPLPDSIKAQLRADGVLDTPEFPPDCKIDHPNVPALADRLKPGVHRRR